MNPRFTKHISSLEEKGWFITPHHEDAVVSDDFCFFISYWPHNGHISMSAMNIERYWQFKKEIYSQVPTHLQDSSMLAGFVAESGADTFKPNKKAEELHAMALAMYMQTTSTGSMYEQRFSGSPFAFMAIMYPSNKKFKDFAVRPTMFAPLSSALSVDEANDFIDSTLKHDLDSGKKHYFKYIKDVLKKRNIK